MDPKDIIRFKQHVGVLDTALTKVGAAAAANNDAQLKEAMKVYRLAEKKLSELAKQLNL